MAPRSLPAAWLSLCCCLLAASASQDHSRPSSFIVQMAKSQMPASFAHHSEWYASAVMSLSDAAAAPRMIYQYDTAFHGFAAVLTDAQAHMLAAAPGVVAVRREEVYQLHTTRSPDFLGITSDLVDRAWDQAAVGDHDVILGVLDTGIWPESQSFNDTGMAPVPARWKGACEAGRGFASSSCNRKIVGARAFYSGYEASAGSINDTAEFRSPRDQDGHGTHTAATAAGAPVPGADLFGYAAGTARGMAQRARLAVYKVCWARGCFSSDILAAVDRAVADGVDILSISLGAGGNSYYHDTLAIAAFGAMEMGVFVACSAGNAGPDPVTVTNVAPWIATVGASTMDRDFPSVVTLGDGSNVTGVSLYRGPPRLSPEKQYPVVYMGGNISIPSPRSLCLEGTLEPRDVEGKIVLCDRGISPRVQKGQVVKDAGGVGMILANTAVNGEELVADSHLLPALAVGQRGGNAIKKYAQAAYRPTATIAFEGTKLGVRPSPVVAAFSSRGPNMLTMEVLKPDMVAPGVNVLAAWSGMASPSSLPTDRRRVGFNILSGTSMSCPHVAGVAALVKASHPEWSPAAIKSALMTTAYVHDNTLLPMTDAATGKPTTAYDHGAGHIHPTRALDPGLVYDIGADDYFEFLCAQKLTPLQLRAFDKHSARKCRHTTDSAGELNYPAFAMVIPGQQPSSPATTQRRTVTNVGSPSSTYHVKVTPFKGAEVTVEPTKLHFTRPKQKLTYKVSVRSKAPQSSPEFGSITWTDGVHHVRSPVVLTWLLPV